MNALDIINADHKHSDVIKISLKITINALTAALVSEGMSYVGRTRRGQELPHQEPVTIDSFDADEARGQELADTNRFEQGFDVKDPYGNMCVLQGLRFNLYDELAKVAFDPKRPDLIPLPAIALNTEPPATDTPNYLIPMSAERMLAFRVQIAANIDPRLLVAMQAEEPDEDAEVLKGLLKGEALRKQAQLKDMAPEVLEEILGLPATTYDNSGFQALPIDMQIRIVEKVKTKLDAERKRLLVVQVRTQSTEISGLRKMLANEIAELVSLTDTMTKRAAGRLSIAA